ncbi:hypothetical protein CAEBREN_01908 [Caenorhabditis brenneri]|uniref:RNA-directed DNA polymerase n=1 Tax=Caenorhabditis brenneri TaxID=135651 RepID=G0MYJ9_CAEBE|nr:hypothetical protein CAEBREN_01908 [Caenorhabditis brenneri]
MDGLGDVGGSAEERQLLEDELLRDVVETDAAIRDDGRSSSMEVDVLERETMQNQLVREDEMNRIFGETAAAINLQTTFSKKQISECFLKDMREFTDQMHTLLCQKEFDILEAQNRETKILKENCDLQLHLSQILSTSDQAQQPPRLDYLAQFTEENQKILIEMVQYMNRNGVDSIEEMNDFCQKTSEKRRCELQKAQQEVAKFKADNLALRHEKALLKSHLAAVESQRDDWKRKEGELRRKIEWNTYSRPGRLTAVAGSSTPKIDIQTLARELHQETPPQPRPRSSYGKQQTKENNTEKEAARFYNANTQEILDDDDIPVEETLEQFLREIRKNAQEKAGYVPTRNDSVNLEYRVLYCNNSFRLIDGSRMGVTHLKLIFCRWQENHIRRLRHNTHSGSSYGKQHMKENNTEKEAARFYNANTQEILDDDDIPVEETLDQETHSHYHERRTTEHSDQFAQNVRDAKLAKSLPNPPKFTADENSISIEEFEEMFKMKYQFYTDKQQVLYLGTTLLGGKALKAFRGLAEKDKKSAASVLHAIKIRLCLSSDDESRRAIDKFEKLTVKKGESVEDFCLRMDDVSRVAHQGMGEGAKSMQKLTKLLNNLHFVDEGRAIEIAVDSAIRNVSREEQYDVARETVTRLERQRQDRQKEMSRWENEKRNTKFFNKNTNLTTQKTASNGENAAAQPDNLIQANSNQRGQNQGTPIPSQVANQYQFQNSQNMQANQKQSFVDRTQGNWRDRQKPNELSQKCTDCNQMGPHDPRCPKAPKRYLPTCYACKEVGHYANECPVNKPQQARHQAINLSLFPLPLPQKQIPQYPYVPVDFPIISLAEVNIMLDSGACISLIGKDLWEEIVSKNGVEWGNKAKEECTEFIKVYAANNEPIKLHFQVKAETSLHSRTRDITYYVADVDRDTIILGIDHFDKLGIKMSIESEARDIRMAKTVTLYPGAKLFAEVKVGGMIDAAKNHCLVNPTVPWLSPSVCQVTTTGKGVIQVANYTKQTVVLEKGQKIATGELDGFQVIQEKAECMQILEEHFGHHEDTKDLNELICSITGSADCNEHWKVLCEHLKKESVGTKEEEEVWGIVRKFQHIFAVDDNELGRTNAVECEIELVEGAEPVRQKPRPIPLAIRPEIRKMIQKMLAQGVIRESHSPWASPVVLVKKKDGSVRMCIDYRKVNKVVRYNAHPLPNIEATLQSLSGKKVFTTLDLLAGYWQIPLKEQSKEITAFAIGSELFEWNVLPFGLVTSPAIFQATMESVIGDMLGICAFVYVDDLLIASESLEQHAKDLERVLERVEKSGMRFRASKCHIAQEQVAYLGHKITPEGVRTEEAKIDKMKKFPRPTNPKEVQSFLGLVGYYRKFVINFAQMASALTPLTAKQAVWRWEEEQEAAFQSLIQAICSTPVLMQPNTEAAIDGSKPFLIYTDASRKGVGAVLAQQGDDGEQHPIAFASKALTPAETRYHITDLEALGMIFALRRFKTIVYGTQILVYTDHKPLIYLLRGTPLADRLLRWSIELLEYNVKIIFVNGKANNVADALSRGGCEEAHEGVLAGHFGVKKMYRQLSKKFYWPKMRASIESFVRSCQKCLCTNDSPKLVAPLNPYITSRPLEIVACDLVDIGVSTSGNRYMLTIIDLFTKYGTAIPIPDKRGETVLKAFVDRWAVGEGRIPETLLTDQGKEFVNEHFQNLAKILNIKHITTKGYNSRANGGVERFNKTITHIIKKKNRVSYEWDEQVRLMCCRCERKCTFVYRWPTGVPKTQTQELRSSSPTHLAGMVRLLEMNPDLSSDVVYGLSGKDVPSLSELPMDSLWPIFGQCPSFHIWLEEIKGWSKEYSYYHSRMIQKHLGNDLLRKAGTVVLLLPSVRQKEVMIGGSEVVSLEAESWRETMEMLCKRNLQHIIMVIPFFHEAESQDEFKQIINVVPATTKLTLVPGYFAQLDYAKVPEFCRLYGRLLREQGTVESVLPEDRVSTAQNQTLINLTGSVKLYWERVQTIVKERSMQWPTDLTSTQTSSPVPHQQEQPRTSVTTGPMRTPHQKLTPAPYPREFQRTTYRRQ